MGRPELSHFIKDVEMTVTAKMCALLQEISIVRLGRDICIYEYEPFDLHGDLV